MVRQGGISRLGWGGLWPVFTCGCSFDTGTGTVSWQVEDGGDEDHAADGTHKQQPLGPVFTPTQLHAAMAPGTGGDGE